MFARSTSLEFRQLHEVRLGWSPCLLAVPGSIDAKYNLLSSSGSCWPCCAAARFKGLRRPRLLYLRGIQPKLESVEHDPGIAQMFYPAQALAETRERPPESAAGKPPSPLKRRGSQAPPALAGVRRVKSGQEAVNRLSSPAG